MQVEAEQLLRLASDLFNQLMPVIGAVTGAILGVLILYNIMSAFRAILDIGPITLAAPPAIKPEELEELREQMKEYIPETPMLIASPRLAKRSEPSNEDRCRYCGQRLAPKADSCRYCGAPT